MRLNVETVTAWFTITASMLEEVTGGLKLELVDRLAYIAYMEAVETGKPRRKAGYYKSRFKRGRFADFASMRVSTEQPHDLFIRNLYALVMSAEAMYTKNRRARWGYRQPY
jgi:hypothetical protein